ncbi:MAG: F0F1 ATP synthase subunit epsilon [Firmicutes bacterium]|nr:F0F1 ATP synthase subunit epsilon [Bacillota bacterium]
MPEGKKFNLEIVTPEKVVYQDQVESVIFPAWSGYYGVMANHTPFITGSQTGTVTVRKDNEVEKIAVTKGFVQVQPDRTIILVETAERAKDIDVDRAKRAYIRAWKRLKSKLSSVNYTRAQVALERAANRLKTLGISPDEVVAEHTKGR